MSHRSTSGSASFANLTPSRSASTPASPYSVSTAKRVAMAQSLPTALAHLFQRLEPEARAVLERAAVLVLALVVVLRQELQRQVGMRAVDVDDVEAGIARAHRRIDVVLLHLRDIVEIHFLAVGQRLELGRVLARAARCRARFHVRRVRGAVPQLDTGQRVELVDVIGHRAQVAHVARIPDARRQPVRVIRLGMDRAVFGVDAGPAALGLERAMRRLEPGPIRAGADAMRHLVEPVAQGLGPDLDRLEQDVVFGIARHKLCPPSCRVIQKYC